MANQAALVEAASARLGALSRASCPALPRLANNTGTSRTARARRRRRSCSCSGTRTTFRPAPPRARRYRSRRPGPRAFAAPSRPLLLGGQKGRSNSGVSTFPVPALPARCSSGSALSAQPRLAVAPGGSSLAAPQPLARCSAAAEAQRARGGCGLWRSASWRWRREGCWARPSPGATLQGAAARLGAQARAKFAGRPRGTRCGSAGKASGSAGTWPSWSARWPGEGAGVAGAAAG